MDITGIRKSIETASIYVDTGLFQHPLEIPKDLASAIDILPRNASLRTSNFSADCGDDNRNKWNKKPAYDELTKLVLLAVEQDTFEILGVLFRKGWLTNEHRSIAVETAHESGNLVRLLTLFWMKLARNQTIAQMNLKDCLRALALPETRLAHTQKNTDSCYILWPSKARLLANFVSVPTHVATDVLESISIQMVLFDPQTKTKEAPMRTGRDDHCLKVVRMPMYAIKEFTFERGQVAFSFDHEYFVYKATHQFDLEFFNERLKRAFGIPLSATSFAYIWSPVNGSSSSPLGAAGGMVYFNNIEIVGMSRVSVLSKADNRGSIIQGQQSTTDSSQNSSLDRDSDVSILYLEKPEVISSRVIKEADDRVVILDDQVQVAFVGPSEHIHGMYNCLGDFGGLILKFPDEQHCRMQRIEAGQIHGQSGVSVLVPELTKCRVNADFPRELGALYIQREVTLASKTCKEFAHVISECFIQISIAPRPLQTSQRFQVTLPFALFRSALIPAKATHFSYIYQGKGLPNGGFIYFLYDELAEGNQKYISLAINSINFFGGRSAFAFGIRRALPLEAAMHVKKFGSVVSDRTLRKCGVRHYYFCGPGEMLPGGFRCGTAGGFAYFVQGSIDAHCFFPIASSSEVMDRALVAKNVMSFYGDDSDVATLRRCLGGSTDRCFLARLFRPKAAQKRGVQVYKISLINVLDVNIFFSLARSCPDDALETIAVKAITSAGFVHVRWQEIVYILFGFVSVPSIVILADAVRHALNDHGAWKSGHKTASWIVVSILQTAVYFFILTELLVCIGFARRGFLQFYMVWTKAVLWLCYLIQLASLIAANTLLSTGHMVSPLAPALRPAIAFSGAWMCGSIVYHFRCFECLDLGKRILPVMHSVLEVTNFLLIMIPITMAYFVASFAMSPPDAKWDEVFLSTYRLNFLIDFDVDADILFKEEGIGGEEWEAAQKVLFVIFSFLVGIALMNIFIGVMSSAFDRHTDSVNKHFARARANVTLRHLLMMEAFNAIITLPFRICRECTSKESHNTLWYCLPIDEVAEDKRLKRTECLLRETLMRVRRIEKQLHGQDEEMNINTSENTMMGGVTTAFNMHDNGPSDNLDAITESEAMTFGSSSFGRQLTKSLSDEQDLFKTVPVKVLGVQEVGVDISDISRHCTEWRLAYGKNAGPLNVTTAYCKVAANCVWNETGSLAGVLMGDVIEFELQGRTVAGINIVLASASLCFNWMTGYIGDIVLVSKGTSDDVGWYEVLVAVHIDPQTKGNEKARGSPRSSVGIPRKSPKRKKQKISITNSRSK